MPQRPDDKHVSLQHAVRTVSGVTLMSRFGGLVRDLLIGRMFGETSLLSSFSAAFAIPNLFRRLFGEGALSAAFIPAYTDATHEDPADGTHARSSRFASLTLAILGVITSVITVLAEIVVLVVVLAVPHTPERDLSLKLIMVTLPFMPLICVAAILAGMLQVHGRFGPASSGPLFLNAFMVAVAVYFLAIGKPGSEPTAYILSAATVASAFTQCTWFAKLLRPHFRFTLAYQEAVPRARVMVKRFVPVAIGLGTLQLNAFIDMLIAMYPIWIGATVLGFVYPLDDKSNGILTQAQRLYQFPLGVFGIAVATAVFPMLSRHAADAGRFVDTLRRGLRLSLFIGLPASVGLALVRSDITYVMYGGGSLGFSAEGTARMSLVVLGYAPGIWAYSINHVFTRGFYALGDTATPMRVSIWMVFLNFTLNVVLIWVLREAGLAWSTTIAASVQSVVLLGMLSRRVRARRGALGQAQGEPGSTESAAVEQSISVPAHEGILDAVTRRSIATMAAVTVAMAGCVLVVQALLPTARTWVEHAVSLAVACVVGGGAYFAAARFTRLEELGWLLQRRVTKNGSGNGSGSGGRPPAGPDV